MYLHTYTQINTQRERSTESESILLQTILIKNVNHLFTGHERKWTKGRWSKAWKQNMREELSYAAFQYLFIIYAPKQHEEITSEILPRDQHACKWFSLQLAVIERCRTAKTFLKRDIPSISGWAAVCILRKCWEISSLVLFRVTTERRSNCAEIWWPAGSSQCVIHISVLLLCSHNCVSTQICYRFCCSYKYH